MTKRPQLVILHEETGHTASPLAKDTAETVLAAREAGCEVHIFSSDFDLFGSAEEALENLPSRSEPVHGVWLGFIPSPDRYRAIYEAARARNVVLLNDPDDYQLTSELDRFYPRLVGITPKSAFVTSIDDCSRAIEEIGLPVFVKGVVRSARTQGWAACVAETEDALTDLTTRFLKMPEMKERSRGRVVVRELVRLKHARVLDNGFPLGREFRVILHRGEVMGHGYYWPDADDPLATLDTVEERAVLDLAREAARRVGAKLMTVDVGQKEDDSWTVIETGDPQFAGWSHAPRKTVFERLVTSLQIRGLA